MKIALITGASSGIGKEFVRQIALFYHSLDEIWVIARRKERLSELADSVPAKIRIYAGDLTCDDFISRLSRDLESNHPDIRLLVNSAGIGESGSFFVSSSKNGSESLTTRYGRMIDLNCKALTYMCHICVPYMRDGARIIQIASAAAFSPQPYFAVYSATKSYVQRFSQAIGWELAQRRIYVTTVCPGPVDTEFFETAGIELSPFKKMFLAPTHDVVARALSDSRNKKKISVYGTTMKCLHIAGKLVPSDWMAGMSARLLQSSHKKYRQRKLGQNYECGMEHAKA